MGIKQIFQEGMREFKRQSALRKEKRYLSQKEELLSEQLTETGKKAWESQMDIDSFGNSKKLISRAQNQMDKLNSQLSESETKKADLENKKKEENESFNSQRKEVEAKKKEVDTRLNEEKIQLKNTQKEITNAENRLNQIGKEEDQLNTKSAAPETTEEEKSEIKKKLEAFKTEKQNLEKKRDEASGTVKTLEEKIRPLEEESAKYQKKIDEIRAKQKKVIGQLDESLSKVNKEISDNKNKLAEITKEQNENFRQLGEKLAAAQVTDEAVAAELNAVNTTKKEMEDIQLSVQSLEHQGTAASRSAMWKMIGLIAAGVVVVVGIIIVLILLLGTDKKEQDDSLASVLSRAQKTTTPETAAEAYKQLQKKIIEKKMKEDAEKSEDKGEKTPTTPEEAIKKMDEVTAEIKERSEQIQGKEIVVTDKETFISVLPDISGWKMEDTSYNRSRFGQLETSHLYTTYVSPEGQRIRVHITDTATASAALRTYKMVFSMNISRENDNGYEKISTYKNTQVIEKYTKDPPETEFVFIVKDRYLVELECEGKNSLELLKNFISFFDLSTLQ